MNAPVREVAAPVVFHGGKVVLHPGDCMKVLATLADNSVDAVVTDPPYHLTSIVKRFGSPTAAPAMSAAQRRFAKTGGADRKPGTDQYGRLSKGFMGKVWDGGDIAFTPELWAEVLRVLKPGGHMVAFSGTRTYHRMACAIEDAGFEIRDQIGWCFGSGFPKSHDVSKGIDRAAGAEREIIGLNPTYRKDQTDAPSWTLQRNPELTAPATDAARQWQGWGTALKPAWEPICLARKPLSEGTVAANVLRWGTGAINVDACRVAVDPTADASQLRTMNRGQRVENTAGQVWGLSKQGGDTPQVIRPDGRFPANLIHDGSPEVLAGFPEPHGAGVARSGKFGGDYDATSYDMSGAREMGRFGDSGSAARFFYTAKADAEDRLGSKHPTVKPVDLMQWLVRLICPKGGTVLDPFAGTGTTGAAAFIEGMRAILIEREAEYQADIARRMELLLSGPDERSRKLTAPEPAHNLPLFTKRNGVPAS